MYLQAVDSISGYRSVNHRQKFRTQISLFGSTAGQGGLGSLAFVADGAPLLYLWGFITSRPSLPGACIPTVDTVLFFPDAE